MNQKHSPFKFLDAYEKEDIDVFFGRTQETQNLYDALSGVKHLLVYGPSGSGKSSLVECGLRNQFSDTDWFALTIRKGRNINESVFLSINEALDFKIELDPMTKLPVDPDIGFTEAVEHLYEERFQPVYLLFDQFEELLISGSYGEKVAFFKNLNDLIRSQVPGRVLLIMREEFIGHFSEFEHLCPSIFEYRFRVEKMGRSQVQEVVQDMLEAPLYRKHFDVANTAELAEKIMTKLPDQRKEIELSHVQVFLGELWDRANEKHKGEDLPIFSVDLIRKKDNLESVLESFLKKQMKELENAYGKMVPLEMLATMISEKFTKLQLSEADIKEKLEINEVRSKRPIAELLNKFQQRRIIRALKIGEESKYEISHDTLALVVGQNLTEEMKMREKALDVYNLYEERESLFDQETIDYLRPFKEYLAYPDKLKNLVSDSIANIKAEENEKIQNQKKQLRRTRIFAAVISVIGVGAIIASVFAIIQTNIATKATDIATKSQKATASALNQALSEKSEKDNLKFKGLEERVGTIITAKGCPAIVVKDMEILIAEYDSDTTLTNYVRAQKTNILNDWKSSFNDQIEKFDLACGQIWESLIESQSKISTDD